MNQLIQEIESSLLKKDLPRINIGDTVKVFVKIKEGGKERTQGYEGVVIKRALAEVNGRVTHAASLLEMRYQSLAYIIERRHPDLLKKRTPIRRRQRQKRK